MDDNINAIIEQADLDEEMLDGMDASEATEAVMDMLRPLGGEAFDRNALASDITDIISGSAITVDHVIGVYQVEAEITDDDDLVVTIDGTQAIRLTIAFVDVMPVRRWG